MLAPMCVVTARDEMSGARRYGRMRCGIRTKPITHSDSSRSLIPDEPITDSGPMPITFRR